MNKHKGNSIKHVKTIASENKTKKSPKSEVDSPDLPSFLGLLGSAMNGNKNTNKKMMRIKSKTLTLTEIIEKREQQIEVFISFFFFVCLDLIENKYKERN